LKLKGIYDDEELALLENCTLCPRECGVNRFEGGDGICGTDAGLNVASICIHRGEEPAISGQKGICNIFFSGCSLSCIYCQNHEISHPVSAISSFENNLESVTGKIADILSTGINAIGFVTPSHVVPQMKTIVRELNSMGYHPAVIYNTSSYDKVETLRSLAGIIDVYLPDLKYVTPSLSSEYSGAADYPEVAIRALKEMYFQKGSSFRLDDNGNAEYGMLIRHLVLPGHADESIKVLETIAEELSPGVHLSLMSQYHPVPGVRNHPILHRTLRMEEYRKVAEAMEKLGFRNGWVQDIESNETYRPDFSRDHPFE
jgi:putative pyruvate formate lyase activating enzyme